MAVDSAAPMIQPYERMELTDQHDREVFVAAMLEPAAPNDKLRATAVRYRTATEEHF